MLVRRLSAVDAQTYWTSAKIPNDQFLLYGFGGIASDLEDALRRVGDRARRCPEFGLRIRDHGPLAYPSWVGGEVAADQFIVHPADDWSSCLAAVVRLNDDQLDPRVMAWRLHVFPSVGGMPGAGRGTVAVLQMAHALADGIRSSALAAWLFGRDEWVPAVAGPRPLLGAALPWRGYRAARAHRQLVRDTEAGLVAPQADPGPALRSNARPEGACGVRTLVRKRSQLSGPTVTVGVLAAVSTALSAHLRQLGDDPSRLRAEVPMAKAGERTSHNHFGNVGVGLYPDLPFEERMDRIAEDLEQRRRRASHPAMAAADRAAASVPAPLLRWGIAQFDPTVRSPTAIGNTVVSSVNRGAADLVFGDATVVLTAGLPSLSPMMGLTHGVHGIGDTIAVSVHAAESAIGDIDAYVERLDAALAVGTSPPSPTS
ncbi:WS/DGAT domain-containing protein [Mycobacterium sp. B14F4]|uniref:WS/DGAT domain-containing protein n=1 Tax=Mycobacterium sp. B14F4 TaxID=3153565 RepID=UPI00325F8E17